MSTPESLTSPLFYLAYESSSTSLNETFLEETMHTQVTVQSAHDGM
jgi:hypothetical protein